MAIENYNHVFDEQRISIELYPKRADGDEDIEYEVSHLKVVGNNCDEIIKEKINEINNTIDEYQNGWNIFYLFKEIIQKFADRNSNNIKSSFNYFRGQAFDFPSIPSIYRDNNKSFRKDFESLYLELAKKYPEDISYSKDDHSVREKSFEILQHYGFPTPLLDITANPYIALSFLANEQLDNSNKNFENMCVLEMYSINPNVHSTQNIFLDGSINSNNKRMIAQEGAFLNFEKISKLEIGNREKISKIKFVCHVSTEYLQEKIDRNQENIEMFNNPKNDFEKKLVSGLKEKEKNSIVEALKNSINVDTELISNYESPEFKKKLLIKILDQFKNKLDEYYYFEDRFFPDLYKQIEYMKKRYDNYSFETVD